jgi:shikimate dehydrogenase
MSGQTHTASGLIVINATSLGLSASDPHPFDAGLVDETMLIAEVIAKPEVTPLLEAARRRGAQIHSGIHMIHGQIDLIAAHMAA